RIHFKIKDNRSGNRAAKTLLDEMNLIIFSMLVAGTAFLGIVTSAAAGASPSSWVYPPAKGNLLYAADINGVRISDFSDCGYKRGEVPLPHLNRLVEENRWIWVGGRI